MPDRLPPVLITDGKYRTALAAVQALGMAGCPVYIVQAQAELQGTPPAFVSRYVKESRVLPGSVLDEGYPAALAEICRELTRKAGRETVLFPVGADTLAQISAHRELFAGAARFLAAPPDVLERANDKRAVGELARALGVPVPEEYDCRGGALPSSFPVVIKPRCGEKLGLHVTERYRKVYDPRKFPAAYEEMARRDPQAVVQELLTGDGEGVCVLMDQNSRPVSVLCHRRVREYPIQGGPSACCESIWDETLVGYAVTLLQALGFVGMEMVEFKGGKLLEINPRVWGSFPLTLKSGCPFTLRYVQAACGEELPLCTGPEYRLGLRMRFFLNDSLACFSYLRHGQPGRGLRGLADLVDPRSKEALFSCRDPKPFFTYLKNNLKKREG